MSDNFSITQNEPAVTSLGEAAKAWSDMLVKTDEKLTEIQREIDDLAYELYDIGEEDRQAIESMLGQKSSDEDVGDEEEEEVVVKTPDLISELIDYSVGCCFGRFDIRCATGEKPEHPEPDPFDPLPVCSPGMLQNDIGLPAEEKDIPGSYPLRISWPGILVDDPGHPEDIHARVRNALEVIWMDRAEAIEQEACEILNVKNMRDYLRRPNAFFVSHQKRFSKSRRQAPIYWPVSTISGNYTLWFYYHSLTDQTFYLAVNDFVEPKIKETRKTIQTLEGKADLNREDREQLEEAQDLEAELQDFIEELRRLAPVWKPNLNDGVQITAAPLWKLFQHKPWQKVLKETWGKLEKGDYDWAHLAYSYWPERVKDKCRTDKSLAIAHGLEDLYES